MKHQWKVTSSYAQRATLNRTVILRERKKNILLNRRQKDEYHSLSVCARVCVGLGHTIWHWTGIKIEPKSSDLEIDKIDDNDDECDDDDVDAKSMFNLKPLQLCNKFNFHVYLFGCFSFSRPKLF